MVKFEFSVFWFVGVWVFVLGVMIWVWHAAGFSLWFSIMWCGLVQG